MKLQKLVLWGSVASGVAAAYLMYRRGEGLFSIARKTTLNPVGSLVSELRGTR